MRILLIAALVSSVAVAGCRGGDKNSSTSANSSSNNSASASSSSTADAFRQLATSQCENAIRSNPQAPKGFDAAGTCNCAIQTAFKDQADPISYAKSPEGQQALTKAIVSCGQERMGSAGAATAKEEEGQ